MTSDLMKAGRPGSALARGEDCRPFLLITDGLDPYRNLAVEHLLTENVPAGTVLLYLWQNGRSVIIGRNQNLQRECSLQAMQADGILAVRRFSGGGAVYHDPGNLNFSFIAAEPLYNIPRQMSVIRAALESLGIRAEVSGRNDLETLLPDGSRRKVSGNAFYQDGPRHCHHGTLLLSLSMQDLSRYLTPGSAKLAGSGVASVRSRVGNLKELEPKLTLEKLEAALAAAFCREYGAEGDSSVLAGASDPADIPFYPKEAEIQAFAERLASPEWLYGSEPPASARSREMRFSWGTASLEISAARGRCRRVRLYTDALDTGIAPAVSEIMTRFTAGRPFTGEALRDIFTDLKPDRLSNAGILQPETLIHDLNILWEDIVHEYL